ncbi:MAG: polysaccharide biosynthesis/export family protein [Verrucomicrobiota bacterium]
MLKKSCSFIVNIAFIGGSLIATPHAFAQPASASADKLDIWRQTRQEFITAEQELVRRGFTEGQLQRQVVNLTTRKADLERQIRYYQSKYEYYLKSAVPSDAEEAAKRAKDMAYWDSNLKAAQAELESLNVELAAKVKELQEKAVNPPSSNLILPGDAVQLFVLEDESFNGLYQVRRGGYIILPRVGRVNVAGKDLAAAEKAIKDSLEATQLRQGTVMLERSQEIYATDSNNVIYLAGEFTNNGPLRIPEGVSPTIVTTILRSGGVTKSADLTRVKLLRLEGGRGLVEEVNVKAILDGSGLQSDLALNPGDIIVVPAFAPVVYVTGNVKNPTVLTLSTDEDLTAYAAILRSGGFARFASLRKVYVLRDHGNGEKTRIPINIKELQAGKVQDVVLQGRDIVVVPESFWSW